MTDEASIDARVRRIASKRLSQDLSNVTMDSHLVNDLRADSLDLVEMIMELESEFGIDIPDADSEKMKTVRDVVNYIKVRVDQKEQL